MDDVMPRFSRRSRGFLDTCHPLIQLVCNELIKIFDCTILCGHRNAKAQDLLFEQGKSRCKWPDSTHNNFPSTAVDMAPWYLDKPHIRWDKSSLTRWYFFGGIVYATACKLDIPIRWGGDWNRNTYILDQTFNDLPHFELAD